MRRPSGGPFKSPVIHLGGKMTASCNDCFILIDSKMSNNLGLNSNIIKQILKRLPKFEKKGDWTG